MFFGDKSATLYNWGCSPSKYQSPPQSFTSFAGDSNRNLHFPLQKPGEKEQFAVHPSDSFLCFCWRFWISNHCSIHWRELTWKNHMIQLHFCFFTFVTIDSFDKKKIPTQWHWSLNKIDETSILIRPNTSWSTVANRNALGFPYLVSIGGLQPGPKVQRCQSGNSMPLLWVWIFCLVGGWTTHLKNMLVKFNHFPKDRGVKTKNAWHHHLVFVSLEIPKKWICSWALAVLLESVLWICMTGITFFGSLTFLGDTWGYTPPNETASSLIDF